MIPNVDKSLGTKDAHHCTKGEIWKHLSVQQWGIVEHSAIQRLGQNTVITRNRPNEVVGGEQETTLYLLQGFSRDEMGPTDSITVGTGCVSCLLHFSVVFYEREKGRDYF